MNHNPLVSVKSHPMLVEAEPYMLALEEFNSHADELMQLMSSASPEMASVAPQMAQMLNHFYDAVKSGDLVHVLSTKGTIYFMASMHGMEREELRHLESSLDVYMALAMLLTKIERKLIAVLN